MQFSPAKFVNIRHIVLFIIDIDGVYEWKNDHVYSFNKLDDYC